MIHVLLGLLLIARQSLYELVKNFEGGAGLFYSASTGSIKRALDVALTRELITVASVEPGGRGKKTYRVTDAGEREFRRWMTDELTGPDPETAALSRLFFLGLLDPEDRAPVIRKITTRFEEKLTALTRLDTHLDTVDVSAEHRDVLTYQRATLEYGIAVQTVALDWFRDRLHQESTTR